MRTTTKQSAKRNKNLGRGIINVAFTAFGKLVGQISLSDLPHTANSHFLISKQKTDNSRIRRYRNRFVSE